MNTPFARKITLILDPGEATTNLVGRYKQTNKCFIVNQDAHIEQNNQ